MPLRDHFRPPVSARASWEGFHGMWPATMVQQLVRVLPENYTAEPRVHLGSYFEIDVSTYENGQARQANVSPGEMPGALATAILAPPEPTFTADADLPDQYEYEVLVYDQERGRRLVAAVEIVSPANKDRPENRRAFVTKCAALLQQGVCVSIVDLITTRNFNLYAELLGLNHHRDPAFGSNPPWVYAVTCRYRKNGRTSRLHSWAYPLLIGQPLPNLLIWLSDELHVVLDLETSYEDTCRVLRIPEQFFIVPPPPAAGRSATELV
jgi:hypothetical protein